MVVLSAKGTAERSEAGSTERSEGASSELVSAAVELKRSLIYFTHIKQSLLSSSTLRHTPLIKNY